MLTFSGHSGSGRDLEKAIGVLSDAQEPLFEIALLDGGPAALAPARDHCSFASTVLHDGHQLTGDLPR